eukprot:775400_1
MSIIKSENVRPLSAILDQHNSHSSVVKSKFSSSEQPPTATFTCEYCGYEFNLKQNLVRHVSEVHGDTCVSTSVKSEQSSSESMTTEPVGPVNQFIYGGSVSSSNNVVSVHSGSGMPDRQRLVCDSDGNHETFDVHQQSSTTNESQNGETTIP